MIIVLLGANKMKKERLYGKESGTKSEIEMPNKLICDYEVWKWESYRFKMIRQTTRGCLEWN